MTSISSKSDGYYKKQGRANTEICEETFIGIVYRQIDLHKQYKNTKREINTRTKRWTHKRSNKIIFYICISETNN